MEPEQIIDSEDYADYIIENNMDQDEIDRRYQPALLLQAGRFFVMYQKGETSVQYGYQAIPKCLGLLRAEDAVEQTEVNRLRRQPGVDLYGNGVLVGLVDTGIDVYHPAFIREDGSSSILSVWDQTQKMPENQDGLQTEVSYGRVYSKEQIDASVRLGRGKGEIGSLDSIGHGTFLAGVIAGRICEQDNFSGIAPDASLTVVRLRQAKKNLRSYYQINPEVTCYSESDVLLGIRYVLSVAEKMKMPIVVCLGIGTSQGGHDGLLPLGVYMNLFGEYKGIGMVACAGNESGRRHHYHGELQRSVRTEEVELNVGEREQGFYMEFWGKVPAKFTIGVIAPTGEGYEQVRSIGSETVRLPFIFEGSNVIVSFWPTEAATGEQLISFRFQTPLPGIWRIQVTLERESVGTYDIWLPMENFISEDTFFLQSDPEITITDPGNAVRVLTVGTYDSSNGSIYQYSSRGYTRDGRIAPDITAPGVNLLGPVRNGQYGTMTGSSVAAACAAGVAVLLFEWGIIRGNDRDMNTNEMSKLMIRGAQRSLLMGYPNRIWGYGVLSAYGIFEVI